MDEMVISADDHIDLHTLPPRLWSDRLPARWRDRAPHVETTGEGDFWVVDGGQLGPSGKGSETDGLMVHDEDDGFRPSTPELRLADMDRYGIQAQVIYGPLRFPMKDPELRGAMLQAFNDWSAEFNAAAPDRLTVLAYLPPNDPEVATSEVHRSADNGFKGVLLNYFEWSEDGMSEAFIRSWDPLWRAAVDTGLPFSFHLGGGGHSLVRRPGSWVGQGYAALAGMQLDEVIGVMALSGTLERYPGLKVVLGEAGIGFIRFVAERLDRVMTTHIHLVKDVKLQRMPSEVIREQVYATFEGDPVGLDLLTSFGEDNFMWATDYPHPAGDFRRVPEALEGIRERCTADQVRKVVRDNCARLYGFGLN